MSEHTDAGAPAVPAAPAASGLSFDGYSDDVRVTLNARGVTPDAQGFKALAEQYHNANKYILTNGARDVIGVPTKEAGPEAWDRVYTALGRPPSPDAYQLKLDAPEGQVNGEFLTFGRGLMHKFGVPAERAQEFVNDYMAYEQKTAAAEGQRQEQVITEIKQREGAAFESKVARGQEAVRKLGLSAELLGSVEKQLGTGPMLQLFMALGSRISEGQFLTGGGGGAAPDPAQMNAAQATAEINRLQADDAFSKAYYDAQHPEHGSALKKMEALYAARSRR